MKTKLYTAIDIQTIVEHVGLDALMDKAILSLSEHIKSYRPEDFEIPTRSGFEYEKPFLGLVEWMPTLKCNEDIVLKVVAYHPNNPKQHSLPSVLSTSLLFDTNTGNLSGAMDSTFTTAIRTGAASAVASRCLARSNSTVLGLVGAGAQAVTQLHALSRVFTFTKVMVFDADPSVSQSFQDRISSLNINAHIEIVNIESLVKEADIICTCTSVGIGEGPVFEDFELQDHVHINAVGADFPGKIEIPYSVLGRSLVCPDFLQQAMLEGECQQLQTEQIGPDLASVIQSSENFQRYQTGSTVFDSTGWALEDYIMAKLIEEYAKEFGLGREIQLSTVSQDSKNPYDFLHSSKANISNMVDDIQVAIDSVL